MGGAKKKQREGEKAGTAPKGHDRLFTVLLSPFFLPFLKVSLVTTQTQRRSFTFCSHTLLYPLHSFFQYLLLSYKTVGQRCCQGEVPLVLAFSIFPLFLFVFPFAFTPQHYPRRLVLCDIQHSTTILTIARPQATSAYPKQSRQSRHQSDASLKARPFDLFSPFLPFFTPISHHICFFLST